MAEKRGGGAKKFSSSGRWGQAFLRGGAEGMIYSIFYSVANIIVF